MTTSSRLDRPRWSTLPISFILLSLLALAALGTAHAADQASVHIKLDQVGYLPGAPKLAVVTATAKTFAVKRASDNATVFKGTLGAATPDADTGDSVQLADFTTLRLPGTYYLDVPGVGRSWTFSIRRDVFSRAYYLAMRAFYGQR